MNRTVTVSTSGDSTVSRLPGLAVAWWLYLVAAAAWFIIAWAVLRFDVSSVATISVLAGVIILLAGLAELFNGMAAPGWRWLHALLGVVFVITAIVVFFHPAGTFAMLAAFIAWYLLFKGMLDIVLAFVTKDVNEAWWLGLIVGFIELLLGFWAAGHFGRSAALLVLFVAAIALTRGIGDIVFAFRLRAFEHHLSAA
jgi:uncharacterized membrane protein HdeD (DUF308 family)